MESPSVYYRHLIWPSMTLVQFIYCNSLTTVTGRRKMQGCLRIKPETSHTILLLLCQLSYTDCFTPEFTIVLQVVNLAPKSSWWTFIAEIVSLSLL